MLLKVVFEVLELLKQSLKQRQPLHASHDPRASNHIINLLLLQCAFNAVGLNDCLLALQTYFGWIWRDHAHFAPHATANRLLLRRVKGSVKNLLIHELAFVKIRLARLLLWYWSEHGWVQVNFVKARVSKRHNISPVTAAEIRVVICSLNWGLQNTSCCLVAVKWPVVKKMLGLVWILCRVMEV